MAGSGGGVKGTLVKTGNGRLTLARANHHTGGTRIEAGQLVVNNTSGTGLGPGPVEVAGGVLGGSGSIAGDITVGTGGGSGAALSPGSTAGGNIGTLTVRKPLTLKSDGSYICDIDSSATTSDSLAAEAVTIEIGAQFSLVDLGNGVVAPGTVFTVINDTAATPIAGTFANLAEGSTIVAGSNTYQASYSGGDGNDLTLTVLP